MAKKPLPPEFRLQMLVMRASFLAPTHPATEPGIAAARAALDLEPAETPLGQMLVQIRALRSEIARRSFRSRAAAWRSEKDAAQ